MVAISKVLSYNLDQFKRRIVKVLRFGREDGKESFEVSPYGLDSGVPKGCMAVYMKSHNRGNSIVLGYINQEQLATIGETRLYSNGSEIWIRKNGDIEIGGNTDNLSSHSELQIAMNLLAQKINEQFGLIASGIATGGGAYTPTPISINLIDAKLDKIKV